jgi:hypothetical protein
VGGACAGVWEIACDANAAASPKTKAKNERENMGHLGEDFRWELLTGAVYHRGRKEIRDDDL